MVHRLFPGIAFLYQTVWISPCFHVGFEADGRESKCVACAWHALVVQVYLNVYISRNIDLFL